MSNRSINPGNFVISLDFELMWGMFDKVTSEEYGDHLRGVHTAIPRLLRLFAEHNIHASWATVGMLTAYHLGELENLTPLEPDRPRYMRSELSAYAHYTSQKTHIEENLDLYLASGLVEKIVKTDGQELASHSFSHYYCLEEQVEGTDTNATFTADALAQQETLMRFKTKPKSMVFPRNQWTKEALSVLKRLGYICYRGTESHFIYRARDEHSKTKLFLRALRFFDRYFNLTGHHTYKVHRPLHPERQLVNVPASRQLHPRHKLLFWLEPMKLRRITSGMTKAAKHGETFHLWWHPHNFGVKQKANFKMLEKIIKHYERLNARYDWHSASMAEAATRVLEPNE